MHLAALFFSRSRSIFVWGALALILASTLHILKGGAHIEGGVGPCGSITKENIPQGFASPFDVTLDSDIIPLLSVSCGVRNAVVEVGSGYDKQYIYRHGYEWRGGMWRPLSFSGDMSRGDWLVGRAQATLSRSESELARDNYVVAYVCTQTNEGMWKCGCRDTTCTSQFWNVQKFSSKTVDSNAVSLDIIPDATLPAFKIPDSPVVVGQPSAYSVTKGTPITFRGFGFTTGNDNTVTFTSLHEKEKVEGVELRGIQGIHNGDETTLTVTPPATLSAGVYRVVVGNKNGIDQTGTIIAVTDISATPPSITSFTPRTGVFGTEVVITGTGFLPRGNVVAASFRLFEDVPSPDGKTLRIPMDPFSESDSLMRYRKSGLFTPTMEVWFSVMNKNGIAGPAGPFTFQ